MGLTRDPLSLKTRQVPSRPQASDNWTIGHRLCAKRGRISQIRATNAELALTSATVLRWKSHGLSSWLLARVLDLEGTNNT